MGQGVRREMSWRWGEGGMARRRDDGEKEGTRQIDGTGGRTRHSQRNGGPFTRGTGGDGVALRGDLGAQRNGSACRGGCGAD